MNLINLTYYQSSSNATHSGTLLGYTFTGKEKDAESGYHYFGARYYDSEALIGWLSVDPMADKYPGLSPYNYCAWNPVELVDPDGEAPVKPLIKYMGYGSFMVNIDNLHRPARNQIQKANKNPHNWAEGQIGINLSIGTYTSPVRIPTLGITPDAVGPDQGDYIRMKTQVYTPSSVPKQHGKPSRPIYSENEWAVGPVGGGAVGRCSAVFMLGLNLGIYAANMVQMLSIERDQNELNRQTGLLNKARYLVDEAISKGVFDGQQASNNDFLGEVINYIFQGPRGDGYASGHEPSPEAMRKGDIIMKNNNIKTFLVCE